MQAVIISALISMVTRLVTAEFIQFCVLKALDVLVARTPTKVDDEFVAKIHEVLEKK